MRVHYCHITGCQAVIRPALLFCSKHWAMVPKDMQKRVYNKYRFGQCDDKNPSRDWVKAASEARRYVERQLRKGKK